MPEEEDSEDPDHQSPWYLFNDFTVRQVTETEALSFPADWKVRWGTRRKSKVTYISTRSRQSFTSKEWTYKGAWT